MDGYQFSGFVARPVLKAFGRSMLTILHRKIVRAHLAPAVVEQKGRPFQMDLKQSEQSKAADNAGWSYF